MTSPLTCSAYPAISREDAERRAKVTAREDGWTILSWDWHPDPTRNRGREGGVLVVRFDALAQVRLFPSQAQSPGQSGDFEVPKPPGVFRFSVRPMVRRPASLGRAARGRRLILLRLRLAIAVEQSVSVSSLKRSRTSAVREVPPYQPGREGIPLGGLQARYW